jgi:hypothetical protein
MNQHDPASALKVEDVRINKQPVQNEHGLAVQCILGSAQCSRILTAQETLLPTGEKSH